jgi:hypothetical protein
MVLLVRSSNSAFEIVELVLVIATSALASTMALLSLFNP